VIVVPVSVSIDYQNGSMYLKYMKQSVYLETTIVSYYTSRPSRDLVVAGHQQITKDWIDSQSQEFDVFISELVINECSDGDISAAQQRLQCIEKYAVLTLKPEVPALARELVDSGVIPSKCPEDAIHIALATLHGIDYLLTWNCKHIANAQLRTSLEKIVSNHGYILPVICTPEELMGE
jgi:predicted nucleic acid-binding protein